MNSIIIAPGFHPYFDQLFDPTLPLNEPRTSNTVRTMGNSALQTFQTEYGLEVAVTSEGLTKIIEWSDKPDTYKCVEPTVCGDTLDTFRGAIDLKPRAQSTFTVEISARKLQDSSVC